jgi:hypothetical protein
MNVQNGVEKILNVAPNRCNIITKFCNVCVLIDLALGIGMCVFQNLAISHTALK